MSFPVRRCETDDDLARSLAIYNEAWPEQAVTAEESAAWAEAQSDFAEFLAGDVGSAVVGLHPSHPEVAFTLLTVLPEARRRGAGSALYAVVSAWTGERGVDVLETRVAGDDEESLAFALRRGFQEHSREAGLELDLSAPVPHFDPPTGIELTTLAERPDVEPQLYDVALETDADVPGEEDTVMQPREEWLARHGLRPRIPPGSFVVALDGDEVIGYAKLRLDPSGRTATHAMTGVKRTWRGRGIARALKSRQIAWAKQRGLERLRTTNELRNAPMRRVNELLGYTPAAGRVTLRGPLANASS
jgi:GNAT superfamily N-acetyltransferase